MFQHQRSLWFAFVVSLTAACALPAMNVRADEPAQPTPTPAPTKPAPAPPNDANKPKAPDAKDSGPTCKLDDPEVPRGGRLDVSGSKLGSSPVVRIAGKPARILERREDRISVQVAADSDGGAVTVNTDGKSADCGQLVIIGKNH